MELTIEGRHGEREKMENAVKSEKFWDRLSKNFDKQSKKYEQTYTKIIANTKRYLKRNDLVLDYACGTGLVANEIAGDVQKVQAIDISSKMIEAARKKSAELKIDNVDYTHLTLFDEKLPKGSFDVILANNVMHFIEDTHKLMQRINELLKPGGLIISATVCMGEKRSLVYTFLYLICKIRIIPYMRFFKIAELEDIIKEGKFNILETETLSQFPLDYFIVARKNN